MSQQGYVPVTPDGSGRKIANFAVTLPIGTSVVDKDGNTSVLASAATVFLQRVVLSDSAGNELDLQDSTTHELLYLILEELRSKR